MIKILFEFLKEKNDLDIYNLSLGLSFRSQIISNLEIKKPSSRLVDFRRERIGIYK